MSLSKTRLNQLKSIKDAKIDYTDIPELDKDFWSQATVTLPDVKIPVSLRLDAKVLEWFKKQGKGYQSRINAVLSSYIKAQKTD